MRIFDMNKFLFFVIVGVALLSSIGIASACNGENDNHNLTSATADSSDRVRNDRASNDRVSIVSEQKEQNSGGNLEGNLKINSGGLTNMMNGYMMNGYAIGGMMNGFGGYGFGVWSFLSLLFATGLVILVWLAVIKLWRESFNENNKKTRRK